MIALGVADLVLVASRVLDLDTDGVLDLLDGTAAETALAKARSHGDSEDPASRAAALLDALLRHQPLRRGNRQVAIVAMLQFLALNGWDADLDPPEAARRVVVELAAGALDAGDVATWLVPRLRLRDRDAPCEKEAPMRRWLPVRKRRKRPRAMFDRFTVRARRAIQLAQEEARRHQHNYLGTEHLLLGLIREDQGIAAMALESLGISLEAAAAQVGEIIGQGKSTLVGHIPFTPRAKKVLELSLREALQLGHNYVGTEHILLGLIREGDGVAAQVLVSLGAQHARVRDHVLRLLTGWSAADDERSGPRSRLVRMSVPADLLDREERLAEVRRRKESAIDAGDLDSAAALRDREKQLLTDQLRREREWLDGVDLRAVIEENHRLHREVEHLRGLLRRHGIQPSDGNAQSA
jgi:prophage maintenance system killer protein